MKLYKHCSVQIKSWRKLQEFNQNAGIRMKTMFTMVLFLICLDSANGNIPTWSSNIAKTMYTHCTSCHRDGGNAPFSLMKYEEVASKKNSVLEAITSRSMPPYPADTKFRSYSHQKTLTESEIEEVIAWVHNDAPSGDLALAPNPPTYSNGPGINNPSFTAQMPNYISQAKAGGDDEYRCFVLDGSPIKDEFISAIEVMPGNPEIVHHVLVFQDTSSIPLKLDAESPGPGYPGFGGVGSSTATLIGVYAPGGEPYFFPKGFGIRFQKGARIILQVHYPSGTEGKMDNTSIRFSFSDEISPREVFIDHLLNHKNIVNGPLRIPPGQIKTFKQIMNIPIDATAFAVMPHMHLLGKSTKVILRLPNNDTIPIINIPHWDFHWQMAYTFKTLQKVPKGSILESMVTYDNTVDNPHNPSNPPKEVRAGEGTTDEMMLTYFYYTGYQPGDELIATEVEEDKPDENINLEDITFTEIPTGVIIRFANPITLQSMRIFNLKGGDVYVHQSNHAHSHSVLSIPISGSGTYYLHATDLAGKHYRGAFCVRQ